METEQKEIEYLKLKMQTLNDWEDPLWVFTGKSKKNKVYSIKKTEKLDPKTKDENSSKFLNKKNNLINQKLSDNDVTDNDNLNSQIGEVESILVDWPYKAIGIIFVKYSDSTYEYGTGSLISPGVVLTCANLIINHESIY